MKHYAQYGVVFLLFIGISFAASANNPHEPNGYSIIAEFDASTLPLPSTAAGWQKIPGFAGHWWMYPNPNGNYKITQDPTAPRSGPSVMQVRMPKGLTGGISPGKFGGWSNTSTNVAEKSGQYEKVYLSFWNKINDTYGDATYEQHAVSTKQFYLGFAEPPSTALNEGLFRWGGSGTGKQDPVTGMPVLFHLEGGQVYEVGLSNPTVYNGKGGKIITVGVWMHNEVVAEMNSAPGVADGKLQWWINGVEVLNRSDIIYTTPSFQRMFYNWYYYPCWGGTGGNRTRDDFFFIDHVYISGVLKGSAPTTPVCGNGVVESGEQCDLGASNGACPSTCSLSCTTQTCAPTPKTGDLNNDGVVNIIDVQLVVSKLGQNAVTTGEDVNTDGAVNVFDLVTLARNWG